MTKPKPVKVSATVKLNAYRVISDAVDSGVSYGWRRAHKYTDEPTEEAAVEAIATAVMNDLGEVLVFDEP